MHATSDATLLVSTSVTCCSFELLSLRVDERPDGSTFHKNVSNGTTALFLFFSNSLRLFSSLLLSDRGLFSGFISYNSQSGSSRGVKWCILFFFFSNAVRSKWQWNHHRRRVKNARNICDIYVQKWCFLFFQFVVFRFILFQRPSVRGGILSHCATSCLEWPCACPLFKQMKVWHQIKSFIALNMYLANW